MTETVKIAEVFLVIFFATTFRTAFGFGEALIAVPLLSLILPVKVSAPIAVLASICIALVSVIRDRKHIHLSSTKRLLAGTILGIPLGLLVLRYASEETAKATLGFLIVAFAAFSFRKPGFFVLKNDRLIWFFGFLAGITGGSYGMNGPPLVIYGVGRGWPAKQFRATLQAYFLPASIVGMVGYSISGIWTVDVNVLFLKSLPAIGLGILAGNKLSTLMEQVQFTRFLYGALAAVGLILIFQGVV